MQETDKVLEKQVENIVKKSASSFYFSMRFMPYRKRKAMFAIYAFCRIVDDIADEPGDKGDKNDNLNEWEKDIKSMYSGEITTLNSPVALCLHETIKDFRLPMQELLALIEGMRMDLNNLKSPWQAYDVYLYCRRVAGAVGVLSVYVFNEGHVSKEMLSFALLLGEALQVTNILRDMQEDFSNNRCYVPKVILDRYGVAELSPSKLATNPSLEYVRQDLGKYAEHLYEQAELILSTMSRQEKKALKPALTMKNVYFAYLKKMRESGWEVSSKVKINKIIKLYLALRGQL